EVCDVAKKTGGIGFGYPARILTRRRLNLRAVAGRLAKAGEPFVKMRRCSFCGFSEHLFTSEFMIGLLSGHRELVDKQKTARPSRRGGFSRPVEILFGEFARRTSGGTSIPTQSTVASTARLLDSYLESLLMSTECYRHRDYPATKILCHR